MSVTFQGSWISCKGEHTLPDSRLLACGWAFGRLGQSGSYERGTTGSPRFDDKQQRWHLLKMGLHRFLPLKEEQRMTLKGFFRGLLFSQLPTAPVMDRWFNQSACPFSKPISKGAFPDGSVSETICCDGLTWMWHYPISKPCHWFCRYLVVNQSTGRTFWPDDEKSPRVLSSSCGQHHFLCQMS